jgi:hypothetical protein
MIAGCMRQRSTRLRLGLLGRITSGMAVVKRWPIALAIVCIATSMHPSFRAVVTGQGSADPTWSAAQSETATNVSVIDGHRRITITYNDATGNDATLLYSPTTRTVRPGTSLLGWSTSDDDGRSWTYGGKVGPPAGWAALWGDPAMAGDTADPRYVFISNLAVPSSKMPAQGITGSLADAIGGACIARSEDGGRSFAMDQCVSHQSHAYDGGGMVAAGAPGDHRVFAAFNDVETLQMDVWESPDDTGTFTLMPNPFPGMRIASHPRLRFDRDTDTLYLAAMDYDDSRVYITDYRDGVWATPVAATLATAGAPVVSLSDRLLVAAYQFSYDIGSPGDLPGSEIRFLYTVSDTVSQRLELRGSSCGLDLSEQCQDAPEWGTTPGSGVGVTGDQFNPAIRASPSIDGRGSEWKATYTSREHDPEGNTISIEEANLQTLAGGGRTFHPADLVKNLLVCSNKVGYYGDYDLLEFLGFRGRAPVFIRPYSDASEGCVQRWNYVSARVHISAAIFE